MVNVTEPPAEQRFWRTTPGATVIAGIGAAIIAGTFAVVVALIPKEQPPAAPSAPCTVAGAVVNSDLNAPYSSLQIGYVPRDSGFADDEKFVYITTTDLEGRYSGACAGVPQGSVVAAKSYNWGGCIEVSDAPVPTAGTNRDVNFSVSDKVQNLFGRLYGLPKYDNCRFPR